MWRLTLLSFIGLLEIVYSLQQDSLGEQEWMKRSNLAAFDTLGGIGLGKRAYRENDDYETMFTKRNSDEHEGLKRAGLSSFDTLGGIGLGKRSRGWRLSD
ncbi:hypothetical protein WR25_18787 [Diploscapter pachys]|uniref:Calcitonin peptide-like domain-containing protein n=1 Tax=Diploscapter pachys TaxID=2018661 RepID=A0A2A2JQI9_9BILA|nr:hypothetical protein WR25_18787 [Diploscapter pachys]